MILDDTRLQSESVKCSSFPSDWGYLKIFSASLLHLLYWCLAGSPPPATVSPVALFHRSRLPACSGLHSLCPQKADLPDRTLKFNTQHKWGRSQIRCKVVISMLRVTESGMGEWLVSFKGTNGKAIITLLGCPSWEETFDINPIHLFSWILAFFSPLFPRTNTKGQTAWQHVWPSFPNVAVLKAEKPKHHWKLHTLLDRNGT